VVHVRRVAPQLLDASSLFIWLVNLAGYTASTVRADHATSGVARSQPPSALRRDPRVAGASDVPVGACSGSIRSHAVRTTGEFVPCWLARRLGGTHPAVNASHIEAKWACLSLAALANHKQEQRLNKVRAPPILL
jgi:hypothetical protein